MLKEWLQRRPQSHIALGAHVLFTLLFITNSTTLAWSLWLILPNILLQTTLNGYMVHHFFHNMHLFAKPLLQAKATHPILGGLLGFSIYLGAAIHILSMMLNIILCFIALISPASIQLWPAIFAFFRMPMAICALLTLPLLSLSAYHTSARMFTPPPGADTTEPDPKGPSSEDTPHTPTSPGAATESPHGSQCP